MKWVMLLLLIILIATSPISIAGKEFSGAVKQTIDHSGLYILSVASGNVTVVRPDSVCITFTGGVNDGILFPYNGKIYLILVNGTLTELYDVSSLQEIASWSGTSISEVSGVWIKGDIVHVYGKDNWMMIINMSDYTAKYQPLAVQNNLFDVRIDTSSNTLAVFYNGSYLYDINITNPASPTIYLVIPLGNEKYYLMYRSTQTFFVLFDASTGTTTTYTSSYTDNVKVAVVNDTIYSNDLGLKLFALETLISPAVTSISYSNLRYVVLRAYNSTHLLYYDPIKLKFIIFREGEKGITDNFLYYGTVLNYTVTKTGTTIGIVDLGSRLLPIGVQYLNATTTRYTISIRYGGKTSKILSNDMFSKAVLYAGDVGNGNITVVVGKDIVLGQFELSTGIVGPTLTYTGKNFTGLVEINTSYFYIPFISANGKYYGTFVYGFQKMTNINGYVAILLTQLGSTKGSCLLSSDTNITAPTGYKLVVELSIDRMEKLPCYIMFSIPQGLTVTRAVLNYTTPVPYYYYVYNGMKHYTIDPNSTIVIYVGKVLGGTITGRDGALPILVLTSVLMLSVVLKYLVWKRRER